MYKIMTPGPTQVKENVRIARSLECTNPDLDENFFDFYRETCKLISKLLYTNNETILMGGEGILGLEAACASLTEPGDKVLVLDNGIFGKGFADFVSLYGGEPILYTVDYKNPIDPVKLEAFLLKHSDFKYATLVHCDTPSGMLNPIGLLCPLLKKHGLLTVVDAVSSMFAEEIRVDDFQIDILCGGSQKAVSAPPGLTLVTISEAAKRSMAKRKKPIASFYANIEVFEGYYEKKWFPYTMPVSDIYGLRAAIDNISEDKHMLERHAAIGTACREAVRAAGLTLHLEHGFSNAVTVFDVPKETSAKEILDKMKKDHNIMLAGSFNILEGQVIRIGHMGTNAGKEDVTDTLEALDKVLCQCNVTLRCSMKEAFEKSM